MASWLTFSRSSVPTVLGYGATWRTFFGPPRGSPSACRLQNLGRYPVRRRKLNPVILHPRPLHLIEGGLSEGEQRGVPECDGLLAKWNRVYHGSEHGNLRPRERERWHAKHPELVHRRARSP